MNRYVALMHRQRSGGWGVSFPDFLGCISVGKDWQEAIDHATEALQFHVAGMMEDKADIPAPRSPDAIMADRSLKENLKGAVFAAVALPLPAGKPERINITLDSNLLVMVDEAANAAGMPRSTWLAEAARRMLAGQSVPGELVVGKRRIRASPIVGRGQVAGLAERALGFGKAPPGPKKKRA